MGKAEVMTMNLRDRLTRLEKDSGDACFSHEERAQLWHLMAWQARLKLVGSNDLPPAPSPEGLAAMNRDLAGEDIGRFREKLLTRFPKWQAQIQALSDMEVCALNYDWSTWARDEQLLPGSGQMCLESFLNAAGDSHAPD